jgi:hypothetical protein
VGAPSLNGCQAKTERRRQLAGVGTGKGGTKLHACVAGSRVAAFLVTAAPWEPYFTDNPRIILLYLRIKEEGGMKFLLFNLKFLLATDEQTSRVFKPYITDGPEACGTAY